MSEAFHLTKQCLGCKLVQFLLGRFLHTKILRPSEPVLSYFCPEIIVFWNNVTFLHAFLFPHLYKIRNVKQCEREWELCCTVYFWINISVLTLFLTNILFRLVSRQRNFQGLIRKRVHTQFEYKHIVNVNIKDLHCPTYMIFTKRHKKLQNATKSNKFVTCFLSDDRTCQGKQGKQLIYT